MARGFHRVYFFVGFPVVNPLCTVDVHLFFSTIRLFPFLPPISGMDLRGV